MRLGDNDLVNPTASALRRTTSRATAIVAGDCAVAGNDETPAQSNAVMNRTSEKLSLCMSVTPRFGLPSMEWRDVTQAVRKRNLIWS
jgi:hypothetical protein